jgi:hypothetical protein
MPQAAKSSPLSIFTQLPTSERTVSGLIVPCLLIFATLVVLLWAGGGWLQGYIYNEPSTQLFWRAPAAAAVLAGWLGFWASTEYRNYLDEKEPSRYGALFQFSATDEKRFNEFWVPEGDRKVLFSRRTVNQGKGPGRPEFISEIPPHRSWAGSDVVILKENGQDVTYKLDKKATEKSHEKTAMGTEASSGGARYRSDAGAVITEDMIRFGRISSFRWKTFLTYALLNIGFLVLWFLALWLLVRFQWSHALGLAVVFWFVAIIFVVPPLVERVDRVADAKPVPAHVNQMFKEIEKEVDKAAKEVNKPAKK